MTVCKLFVALAAFVATSGAVYAAENSVPSVEDFDWSGFYVGVYGAYGEGASKSDVSLDVHPADPFPGIHAGYLFDFGQVVLGVEGDASLADLDDDIRSGGGQITQDIDSIASVRARIGLPINNTLLFANAGWAWAETEYGYLVLQDQKSISGPTLGAGAQYAFSNRLIGRLEYNHYFYGTTTYDLETQVDIKNSVDEVKVGVDFIFH
jgi:outer membrane immunogenic protein